MRKEPARWESFIYLKIISNMKRTRTFLVALMMIAANAAIAQCPITNTAFNSGEVLSYNLYYNWQFVWVKVGTASLSTVSTKYNGTSAYKTSLITRGNGKLDKYFVMRDTLTAYTNTTLSPLYFRKGALEGKRYTVDEVWYSYPNGKCNVKMHRLKHDKTHLRSEKTLNECVYDMLNIFTRARSYDASKWQKGHSIKFTVADGNGVTTALLKYSGKETVKGDNGVKYRCLKLSYQEWSNKKKKYKQFGSFYVTDDDNHVPVRLDVVLNVGNAKAYVSTMKGLRNPVSCIVK